jgi:hypothetical protein
MVVTTIMFRTDTVTDMFFTVKKSSTVWTEFLLKTFFTVTVLVRT